MFYYNNRPLGIVFIGLGLVAVLVALGPILLPLLLGVVGLYLINLGLRMIGKPPLIITLHQIWVTRSFRF